MILCYFHIHEHTLPSFQLPYCVSSNHTFFILLIVLFFHFSKSVIMTKHFLKVQGLARGHVRKGIEIQTIHP
jgi:ABC-type iron transport system FetAB permease component